MAPGALQFWLFDFLVFLLKFSSWLLLSSAAARVEMFLERGLFSTTCWDTPDPNIWAGQGNSGDFIYLTRLPQYRSLKRPSALKIGSPCQPRSVSSRSLPRGSSSATSRRRHLSGKISSPTESVTSLVSSGLGLLALWQAYYSHQHSQTKVSSKSLSRKTWMLRTCHADCWAVLGWRKWRTLTICLGRM